ncbi:MAG: hypothetical protein ACRC68_10200 [Clostridium sp.]
MSDFIEYIKHNFLEFFAITISLISLSLSVHSKLKERVKLKINYDVEESFSFGFIFYNKYKILFTKIDISNLSKTSTTISKIYLHDSAGNKYSPSPYELNDRYNKNGLTLYNRNDPSVGSTYNLISENILNNLRVESHGNLSGYVVFFGIEPITNPTNFKLTIETPTKKVTKNILVSPLPDNLKPQHELKD